MLAKICNNIFALLVCTLYNNLRCIIASKSAQLKLRLARDSLRVHVPYVRGARRGVWDQRALGMASGLSVGKKQAPSSLTALKYLSSDSGGYEHDFVGEVSDKYICVICDKVLRDPRLTACCGQHFCDSCLTRWTTTRPATCPHCRSENFQSILNKERIREINELRVRCSLRERGCTWEGEMGSLKGHIQLCGHVLVRCDNFGFVTDFQYNPYAPLDEQIVVTKIICEAEVERRHREQHNEECPYHQYRCAHCGYSDTYDAIAGTGHVTKKDSKIKSGTNHHDECLHFPLDCPNRCGAKNIKRRNMKTHREKCPQEPVECLIGGHACLGHVTHTSVVEHQKDCDFRPYKCDYCGKKGTFASITGEESVKFYGVLETCHYDECLEYPLVCPNGCGETLKRREASIHEEKCPTCPFRHVGCTAKPPQRELDSHCQEEMQKHLLLMVKSLKVLSEKTSN